MLSQSEVQTVLEPYHHLLRKVVEDAWQIWESVPATIRAMLSPTAQATMIHDFVEHEVRNQLGHLPGVVLGECQRLFFAEVERKVVIRFKKLDSLGRASNVQTEQVKKYNAQGFLPGVPDVIKLNLGYTLDQTNTSITSIMISMPNGRHIAWHYSIPDTVQTVATVTPLTPRRPREGGRRVWPKVPTRKPEDENDNA